MIEILSVGDRVKANVGNREVMIKITHNSVLVKSNMCDMYWVEDKINEGDFNGDELEIFFLDVE